MEFFTIAAALPFGFIFILPGILVNLIQAALFLTVWPVSKNAYRKINGVVSELLWLDIIWLMEWWAGLEVKLHTDFTTYQVMGKENALLIPNHPSDVDVFITWLLAQRSGCLRSALAVVKKTQLYLPIFGWATWFFEFVFLDRNWAKDEKKLKENFQALKDFHRPFWLTIFVEGTRLTPDKLLEAQEFALSKGFQVPKNVLIPRTKGFVAAVKYLRSFVPAIYDVTIAVPKGYPKPSFSRLLRREPSPVNIYLKRYSMEDMPESDEGIAQWCRDKFLAKDAFLEELLATGTSEVQEIKEFCRPSIKSLLVAIIWAFFSVIVSSIIFGKLCLLSTWGGFGFLATGVAIITTTMGIFIQYTKLPPQKAEAAS